MKVTQAQLRRRVERWQEALAPLGIGHWRLEACEIVEECAGAGRNASAGVNPSHYYDTCWMQFQRAWLEDAAPEAVDETIIHEWLHVAWRDLSEAVDSAESQLSPQARFVWAERVEHETEGVIERLARTLYHMYSRKVVQ